MGFTNIIGQHTVIDSDVTCSWIVLQLELVSIYVYVIDSQHGVLHNC